MPESPESGGEGLAGDGEFLRPFPANSGAVCLNCWCIRAYSGLLINSRGSGDWRKPEIGFPTSKKVAGGFLLFGHQDYEGGEVAAL